MEIRLMTSNNYESFREVQKAASLMNRAQGTFVFRVSKEAWIPDEGRRKNSIDIESTRKEKERRTGDVPCVIISSLGLKDSPWLADYRPGYYIFTTKGWDKQYSSLPLRYLIASYAAGVCCHFAGQLSEKDSDKMTFFPIHLEKQGRGCISDLAPEGNDDLYFCMKKSFICEACWSFYKRKGCSLQELRATQKILEHVKTEMMKYDRKSYPNDVFISYSRKDRKVVDRLYDALETRLVKVWLDVEQNYLGERLTPKIQREIRRSLTFVPVISKNSKKSAWVLKEIEYAQSLKSKERPKILPAQIDNHGTPGNIKPSAWELLREITWEDLSKDNFDRGVRRLISKIHERKKTKKKIVGS